MYQTLLVIHSALRWLVVASLSLSIYTGWKGYNKQLPFTKSNNLLRHWAATIAHTQLLIGMILYTQSPMVKYYNNGIGDMTGEPTFFGFTHIALMLVSVVLITIGSAKAKREPVDSGKFKTMAVYFSIAAVVLFIAIPWPFSPLSHRPLIRY
ncbi:hypothetical protein GR160_07230 [Flavobacterium sp. Sd200]|uniref:hypothetical protein n=1 Tax=Flavobacterium sp. Sd200 TaxID=2692211 RepID=UPI00136CCAFD|nr:hypothetical protein [Flavobacterium sp. Sd200]MXN91018.1 hypothetical protein [Flavobacterium sp. Sd200]